MNFLMANETLLRFLEWGIGGGGGFKFSYLKPHKIHVILTVFTKEE